MGNVTILNQDTPCPFKCGDVCLWASKLAANRPIKPTEDECSACKVDQARSKQRKGFGSRRTAVVERLSAKELSKIFDSPWEDIFKHLNKESNVWKRKHISSLIKNQSPYFRFLMSVAFYECSLKDPTKDWSGDGFLAYLQKYSLDDHFFPKGFHPNYDDVDSKRSFFKSFDKFLKTKGRNLGDVLKEVEYPVWVEPIEEQELNPQSDKCIVTVVTGEKYIGMFNKVRAGYEEYAKKIGADLVILGNYTQGWWGLEKFRVKRVAEAYEKTCFIDGDIAIQPNAPNVFDIVPEGFVGIHDDWPFCLHKAPLETPPFDIEYWRKTERKMMITSQVGEEDFSWELYPALLNTGVVVTPREHAGIWTAPIKPFPRNHCDEQFWVDYNIRKNNVPYWPLPVSLNFQYWHKCFDYYFHRSDGFYFLHVAIDDGGDKEAALNDVLERKYVNKP
jgi:hypothetical protein